VKTKGAPKKRKVREKNYSTTSYHLNKKVIIDNETVKIEDLIKK